MQSTDSSWKHSHWEGYNGFHFKDPLLSSGWLMQMWRLHIGTSSSILRIKLLWQNVSLGRTLSQIKIRTKGASNQIFFDNNRIMNKVTWKQAVLDGCHLDSGLSKALTNPNCCSTSTKSKSAHSSNNLETSSRANLQVVQHNNTGLWFELFPLMVSAMHFGP